MEKLFVKVTFTSVNVTAFNNQDLKVKLLGNYAFQVYSVDLCSVYPTSSAPPTKLHPLMVSTKHFY